MASEHSRIELLYREQGARIWRSVLLYTGDPSITDEAVAETFAQALRRGAELRAPADWVWTTVFLIARGLLKERTVGRPSQEEFAYEMTTDVADVQRALAHLSPKQRAAVILHYYIDLPLREVASRMGSSPVAVGVHLHRARKRLRRLLEVEHV